MSDPREAGAIAVLKAIRTRRSYGRLAEPAPDDRELRRILEAGAMAPDHGELRPFRFVVLRGSGLVEFGEILEEAYVRRCGAADLPPVPAVAEKERRKLNRAPLVVIVWAKRQESRTISWVDQRDAVVAAAQNILLAAHAHGYGAMWRTGDACSDPFVLNHLGGTEQDAIIGFLYIGTPLRLKEPKAPDLSGLVSEYRRPTPSHAGAERQTEGDRGAGS